MCRVAHPRELCKHRSVTRDQIEVFQDFWLFSPHSGRKPLRDALLSAVQPPWGHAPDIEAELSDSSVGTSHPIVFERKADPRIFLFQHGNRCNLGNIVPCDTGPDLGTNGYNDLLNDFVDRVVRPATQDTAFRWQVSRRHRTLADWTSDEAASALRRFSAGANKATGASHPEDAQRWRDFLIADHHAGKAWNHSHFERWLVEVEHWPLDKAHELALEHAHARDLLDQYDMTDKTA